ncbi:hypothetical protein L195_g052863, partial [Trifolium pratense]
MLSLSHLSYRSGDGGG